MQRVWSRVALGRQQSPALIMNVWSCFRNRGDTVSKGQKDTTNQSIGMKTDTDKNVTGSKQLIGAAWSRHVRKDTQWELWLTWAGHWWTQRMCSKQRVSHVCKCVSMEKREHHNDFVCVCLCVCLTMALMVSSQSGLSLGCMWASSGTISSSSRWRPGLRPLQPTHTQTWN